MNILITGASSGLGQAAAEHMASAGHTVFALDIKPCEPKNGIIPYKADITDIDSLTAVLNSLRFENISLDAIINVAGIFHMDNLLEISEERLLKMIDVNLLGAIRVNKVFFPILNKDGKIIITSSEVAPLDPLPFNSIYSITKTALDCYSQALRQEAGLLGHKVITIRPGAFATPLEKGSIPSMKEMAERSALFGGQSERFAQIMAAFTGKPADPKRFARLVDKILCKKRPKAVYQIHTNLGLKLLSVLPKKAQVWVVGILVGKNSYQ